MNALALATISIGIALLAGVLTGVLRRYALRRSLIDVPNARSSHTVPTPRGGGVAIVLCVLAALPGLAWAGAIDAPVCWGLMGSGALVALVGFADDHGHIAARWRLLVHFIAAAWLLAWMGGAPPIELAGWRADAHWLGAVVITICLAWMVNLYNFMDGIDGIAGMEAITVCVGAAALHTLVQAPDGAALPLTVAAASAGFLYWNFPPAKIFLGDAGSGFLGMLLGAMSLHAAWMDPKLFWAWAILLGVFVVDATFTLLHRLRRGEELYEAHRSHAYQRAARRFGRHLPVTLAVGAINLLWLFPVALLVVRDMLHGPVALLLAYSPLVVLAWHLGAGGPERT